MRFQLAGKTKAVLEKVDIQSQKMGQTELKPAVCLHFKAPMPNSCLAMFSKALLHFLYKKVDKSASQQQVLDGIPVVSEYAQKTDDANAIGAINWDKDQTGCVLHVHHGISDVPVMKLRDGQVDKVKLDPLEGGTVDVYFHFFTTDVDAETLGELAVLKSHELEIELELPEALAGKQASLDDADGGKVDKEPARTKAQKETPKPDAAAKPPAAGAKTSAPSPAAAPPASPLPFDKKGQPNPQTPAEALAAAVGGQKAAA